tara:strand:- start:1697 stop:2998 length:1302 start_codon:yes stop_codon:yes gene_type:complete
MEISSRSGVIILFVTIVVSTLVLFPLLQIVVERDPQLSAYDDDWNDVSEFRTSLENADNKSYNVSAVLSNPAVLDELEAPASTVFVIVGSESPYTKLELEIIVRYMEAGGNLLVFGDFDYSNTIAELFAIEFVKHKLWDRNYKDNVSFIESTGRVNDQYYNVLFNDPVAIKDLGAQYLNLWDSNFEWTKNVFMTTSSNSWIDLDDNDIITPDDETAPPSGFALGVECSLRSKGISLGSAVFIGDSSLPINLMWNEYRNSELVMALIESMIGTEGTILFDESRHTQESFGASLFQAALGFYFLLAGDTLVLQIIRLNVLVAVIILTMSLSLRQPEPKRWFHIFDIRKPRPFRSYGHNLDKGIKALQEVFLERLRLKYQFYEFDDKSRKDRLALLPDLLKHYNVALDEEFKMLLGSPNKITPNDLRSISKKLSTW